MTETPPPSPADLLGPLFAAAQERALFTDSKTFADAAPRRPLAAILADWAADPDRSNADLHVFVDSNFRMPKSLDATAPDRKPLVERVADLWDALTRHTDASEGDLSAIALPRRFVVPGGRFRELYYWDSYFTMLGLVRSGRQDLVEDLIVNFGSLLDRFGRIPNGTRTYYLSRSHPPFFYLMTALSKDSSGRRQRLEWMRIEHRFWMAGAAAIGPGETVRRVVRLADGSLLNRYWDDRSDPRDESWREDTALAAHSIQGPDSLFRNLRAAAESGWDFSARWLGDTRDLGSIRTTRIVPIDLNCLLYGLEKTIAGEARALGDDETADTFAAAASARKAAISLHLWTRTGEYFCDYDLDAAAPADMLTAASLFPLFTGLATQEEAAATATAARRLLRPGGLLTTEIRSGQQWDAPNGWAPLQWIAVNGLRDYGHCDLADEIASGWVETVKRVYAETGQLLEKYDVERQIGGGGGEYGNEVGFGWTNGVTLALLTE